MTNRHPRPTGPLEVPVAVRGYTVPKSSGAGRGKGRRKRRTRRPSTPKTNSWPEYALIFDTETTIDPSQRLLFGCCRICRWVPRRDGEGVRLETLEELLFGSDEPEELEILQRYARNHAADVVTGESTVLKV